jgi:hypothetical protein
VPPTVAGRPGGREAAPEGVFGHGARNGELEEVVGAPGFAADPRHPVAIEGLPGHERLIPRVDGVELAVEYGELRDILTRGMTPSGPWSTRGGRRDSGEAMSRDVQPKTSTPRSSPDTVVRRVASDAAAASK